jgi:DNA-binding NtrC family response regulator
VNRVLLVDDEEDILLAYTKLLRHAHYEVDTAQTMEEAEALLRANAYDIVITDLRLTGVLGEEGLEILAYVREKNPNTAVILVTGYGSPELMAKAYTLGAAHYFEKPLDPQRLIDTVGQLELVPGRK